MYKQEHEHKSWHTVKLFEPETVNTVEGGAEKMLIVANRSLFPLKFLILDSQGTELEQSTIMPGTASYCRKRACSAASYNL
jgi:hypothetical protein